MGRLKLFHFRLEDSWFDISDGYDTMLETGKDGEILIRCLVNGQVQTIDLTGKENSFIQSLESCNIKSWDGNEYTIRSWDGYRWTFEMAYDDVLIRAKGDNAYPPDFIRFLNVLIKHWGLKKANWVSFIREKRLL